MPNTNSRWLRPAKVSILIATLLACGPDLPPTAGQPPNEGDVHSNANTGQVKVTHIDLDLTVDFERQVLRGHAILNFQRIRGSEPVVLDTRALAIESVEVAGDGASFAPTPFKLGPEDPILGAPLSIEAPMTSGSIRVRYETTPGATALQWLAPPQTAGKRQPFLFTQSQAIHARSWIPLQDTPSVKTTYSARIRTPESLRAVMSASSRMDSTLSGDYSFDMPQPVPSYLIALAVGELEFRSLGARTGIYAEKPVIERAASEFEDTERMLEAAERLFGQYRWGRYDILVLPPSFPYGGMENPRLTFATPTILAGDKSLVSLVAHELAHSWSGNLVTNATWRDFWLNEGFTVYLERRILEAVYGVDRAAMEAVLGRQTLTAEMARLPAPEHILHIDLEGRDPDDGMTEIPYEKGALLLRTLEAAYGRDPLDSYLRGYFDQFAFKSITTEEFLQDLQFHLMNGNSPIDPVPVREWVYESGVPAGAWVPKSAALQAVEEAARAWLDGTIPASSIPGKAWCTQEWLHLLSLLPDKLDTAKLAELDRAFQLSGTGNSEILCAWLRIGIRNGYQPAYSAAKSFLMAQGRRKFLRPLYEELARTPEGKARALDIYKQARPTYHPIAVTTIDAILRWRAEAEA